VTHRPWFDIAGGYAAAAAIVVTTVVVKTLVFGADHPFVLLPGAVAAAAWSAGRGPGLLAAFLVVVATYYLMQLPGESVDVIVLVALLFESVLVALLTSGLRTALLRARAASAESAAAHREATFALAVRDELLLLWTQQLRGPMADLEAQARAALADLEHDGYTGAATDKLSTLVQNAALVGRTTAGWDREGRPSGEAH
jgi:K+-sensing histidine kinase KdpD